MRITARLPILLLALIMAVPALGFAGVAEGQRRPKVLFVPASTLPTSLRRAIPRLLRARTHLVSTDAYARVARRRNLSPSGRGAVRRIATRRGADVILVAGFRAWGRSRVLSLTYRDGRTGSELLRVSHRLHGVRLGASAQHAMLREIERIGSRGDRRAATIERVPMAEPAPRPARRVVRTRGSLRARPTPEPDPPGEEYTDGDGGLPPPVDWGDEPTGGTAAALDGDLVGEEEDREEEGREEEETEPRDGEGEGGPAGPDAAGERFRFAIRAGLGFGARSSAMPTEAGPARLTTSPFPALHLALGASVRTGSDESVRLGAGARYFTSVGLRTQDTRSDGTTRTVDARSQYLALGVDGSFRLSDSDRAATLDVSVGYGLRLLSTELPISMPEYTLSGPYARMGLSFPVGSGPLTLSIAPEVASVTGLSDELSQVGAVSPGVAIGAEATVRLSIASELDVEVIYRESHVLLDSEHETDMTDVERWGVVRVVYRP